MATKTLLKFSQSYHTCIGVILSAAGFILFYDRLSCALVIHV